MNILTVVEIVLSRNDFKVQTLSKWEEIEPYYKNLLGRNIQAAEELKTWLKDRSELEAVTGEDARWIYVRTTIDSSVPLCAQWYQCRRPVRLLPVYFLSAVLL